MENINGHNFTKIGNLPYEPKSGWFRCSKCLVEINEISNIFMYTIGSGIANRDLLNLTCEEIIIKNIIE